MQGGGRCGSLPAWIPPSQSLSQIRATKSASCATSGRTKMDAGSGSELRDGRITEPFGSQGHFALLIASCTSGRTVNPTATCITSVVIPPVSIPNTSHRHLPGSRATVGHRPTTVLAVTSSQRRTQHSALVGGGAVRLVCEKPPGATGRTTASVFSPAAVSSACT